jgi:hypothetical protein
MAETKRISWPLPQAVAGLIPAHPIIIPLESRIRVVTDLVPGYPNRKAQSNRHSLELDMAARRFAHFILPRIPNALIQLVFWEVVRFHKSKEQALRYKSTILMLVLGARYSRAIH